MNQPTESAIKCATRIIRDGYPGSLSEMVHEAATMIDKETNLPALTAIALASQSVIDAGRPHTGRPAAYPDGCECEACEAWATLKGAVNALEARP